MTETIEERVSTLERHDRWVQRVGGIAIGLAVVVVVVSQVTSVDDETSVSKHLSVDAREITMVDETWTRRGVMKVVNGEAILFLSNIGKNGGVGLSASEEGSSLAMLDENGMYRIGLSTTPDGSTLILGGSNANGMAELMVDKDGPALLFRDSNGKVIWRAP